MHRWFKKQGAEHTYIPGISCLSTQLERVKYAVGPYGRWQTIIASGCPVNQFTILFTNTSNSNTLKYIHTYMYIAYAYIHIAQS